MYISELTANIMSMGNLSCKLVRKVFVLFYISPMLLSELKAELFKANKKFKKEKNILHMSQEVNNKTTFTV